MNIHQLIFNNFMLIRAAIIVLDLAVLVIVVSVGMVAAAGLRRLRRSDHDHPPSVGCRHRPAAH